MINTDEKMLLRIIDDANVLVLYLDTEGKIILCNRKLEEITGKKKQDLLGRLWSAALYPDQNTFIKQQMLKAVMDDSITYRRAHNFEGAITTADKQERFISWSVTPLLSPADALDGLILIGTDVTELKERQASRTKIDETMANIFASIKEYAFYVVNLDGNITYYSMGSEGAFGWQKSEIIFKHVSLLHPPEEAQTRLPFILEQVRQHGQFEAEIDLRKKDGQQFPVNLTVNQFRDSDGTLNGYLFIAKDITERKKLEYQIFQAEKLAAIGQLAAGMAHEINNPLFVIAGRCEMLRAEPDLAPNVREDLGIIATQAERIRGLVDRMLKFARKSPPHFEKVSVNEIVSGVLPLLAYHKLPTSKIEIAQELSPRLSPINADIHQLQEVLVNLIVNAYQAMSGGGILTITTRNIDNLFAEIRVSDTGYGIPEHELKNIFMPFFSTKKDGTGLGLSICYTIIKNHNGTLSIESQPAKGTTFIIKLPFA